MDIQRTSSMSLRCLCMPQESLTEILKRIRKLPKSGYDLIEVGLESMEEGDWNRAMKEIRSAVHAPLILAARGEKLTRKRLEVYMEAVRQGWEWIDVDGHSREKDLSILFKDVDKNDKSKKRIQVICSYHEPRSTISTSSIVQRIEKMRRTGKEVLLLPKVVVSRTDTLGVIQLLSIAKSYADRQVSVILHPSGTKSRESRLLQAFAGSAIVYLSLRKDLETAKGQWTIKDWNRTIRTL